MGKLFLYEWKKLFRQRSFLLFAAILLISNLFLMFQYEKNTSAYVYFYQQKQEWQKYHRGDETVQNADMYQSFVENEEKYVSSYNNFLKQIPEQAEKLKKTANYQNHNAYLYRELTKTVSDYNGLSIDRMEAEPSIGIKELASYNYGIYFQLIFLFVLSYFVVSAERKKGLFLLTKGTRKGHLPFIAAKVLTMISASAMYGILQEGSVFFLLRYLYGFGTLTRSVQSISIFRDCSLSITVMQALIGILTVRIAIGIFCAIFIACFTIIFRKEGVALIIYIVFVGIQIFFNHSIEISSSLNIAKCVNVFFAWNMENVFGIYQNLNILGYPVSKSVVTWMVGSVFTCVLIGAMLYRFSFSCQVSSGNLLEAIREKVARRTSFLWHHTSLYWFEFRKVFFQQKKGYLFLAVLFLCILGVSDAMEPDVYDNPEEGEYHKILSDIRGTVTRESLSYIANQRDELDKMYEQIEQLKQESGNDVELKKEMLSHEVELRDGGLTLVEQQRDLLMAKEGEISDKYWMDEKKYITMFCDYKYDLTVFLIAAITLVLWVSDIEDSDNRKGLYSLLYTTKRGKKDIQKNKKYVCITGMFWSMICMLIPELLRYYKIDGFESVEQKLSDITSLELKSSMCIGIFLLLLLLLKVAIFALVCGLLVALVRKVHHTSIVVGAGVGTIGLSVLFLWYFHMDLSILLIQLFSLG